MKKNIWISISNAMTALFRFPKIISILGFQTINIVIFTLSIFTIIYIWQSYDIYIEHSKANIINKNLITYLKELNNNYPLVNRIKLSLIISLIFIVLDILNILTTIINNHNFILLVVLTTFASLFIILIFIENGIIDSVKIPSINYSDMIASIIRLSIVIYLITSYLIGQLYLYKLKLLIILFILLIILFIFRVNKYKKALDIACCYNSNVIDLKDLYTGKIDKFDGKMILLSESDVCYDLLGRDVVINQLYMAIVNAKPKGKFVISLEGKWGSGKTTIINNVKKLLLENNKDIVIIDEFDPWTYSDEEALLMNMFSIIIEKSGFKYNNLFTNKLKNDLVEIILGQNKRGFIDSLLFESSSINLKDTINNYLKLSGKKFIFFIDNIDRADKNNVILLFKLVGNVLDFERVTYVLSFDDEKVKQIFKDDLSIDYKYLKKIIQMQIRVPKVDKQVLNHIYATSLNKLLILYGESTNNLAKYDSLINFISQQAIDIRDFKRFANSFISLSFDHNHYLYNRDLLVMEYIKLFNLDLYLSIYRNRKFFISHDLDFNNEIYIKTFNNEDFNIKGKEFFNNLFQIEENKIYLEILSELFPYVDHYKKNQDLKSPGDIATRYESYKVIARDRRICSLNFFDLYFTGSSNNFIIIANKVDSFINIINDSKKTFEEKQIFFNDMLKTFHKSYLTDIFERIQLFLDNIKDEYILDLIYIFYENIELLDFDLSTFFQLGARDRAIFIIYYLLNKISNEDYEVFLNRVKKDYKKLTILTGIVYWFENYTEQISNDVKHKKLSKVCKSMVDEILNKNINLYDDNNYVTKNIWGINHVYEDEKNKTKKYVSSIANEHNIFRILNDAIHIAVGNDYRYFIDKDSLDYLIDKSHVDKILSNVIHMTKDEKFIFEVYKSYPSNNKIDVDENGIILNEKKIIKL